MSKSILKKLTAMVLTMGLVLGMLPGLDFGLKASAAPASQNFDSQTPGSNVPGSPVNYIIIDGVRYSVISPAGYSNQITADPGNMAYMCFGNVVDFGGDPNHNSIGLFFGMNNSSFPLESGATNIEYRIASASPSDKFKLASIFVDFVNYDALTSFYNLTIHGYLNGAEVAAASINTMASGIYGTGTNQINYATSSGYTTDKGGGTISFNPNGTNWQNLDEIRFTSSTYMYLAVDDIVFLSAISEPTVTTASASAITSSGASLNGTVNANNVSTAVVFEYGTTTGYGTTAAAIQSPVTGTSDTPVSAGISGLAPNTAYHYRVAATNSIGTTYGNDRTFTTAKDTPTITAWPAVSGITYGQTFAQAISGGTANVAGAFSIADNTTVPDAAGSPYTKIITFTPADTATYNSVTTMASITVNRADAVISDITCADKLYDGNPLAPSATVTTGSGSIEYTYSGTGITGSTTVAPSNAGTYTITATLPSSNNYNGTSKTLDNVKISKANQDSFTITGKPSAPAYGDAFALSTSGGNSTGTVSWSASGNASVTATGGVVTVTGTGSVTITATKAGDDNYNPATDTYTFTAGKAQPNIGTVTAGSIYVGDALSDSKLSRSDTTISGTLSWETNSAFDSSTPGSKSPTYSFSPNGADSDIYNNLTGQSTTVEVKTRNILSVAAQAAITDKSYGTAQGALNLPAAVNVTVQGINGDVPRSVPVIWSGYNPTALDPQTLTGTLYLAGNNELVNTNGLTASISVTLQPLAAKTINNVSAKIKVGATDGTAILKSLVTSQFDASVDTMATNAANWSGFPSDYNTASTGSVTVQAKYVAGCTPTGSAITINYEIVNPLTLSYTTSVAAIDATDPDNTDENKLLTYVNGLNALTAAWPAGATGTTALADRGQIYNALPKTYVKTGTTYNFSQSYLGHNLSQSITVNEVRQAQPSLTVDYAAEKIDTTTAMAYSTVSGIWSPCTANMSITPWLGQTVNFKTAGDGIKVDSLPIAVVFTPRGAAPANISATINDSNTEIAFTGLAAATAYEYSTDGLSYTDLSADGKLTVPGYISSVSVRKKYMTGASAHSAAANVDVKYTMTFNTTSGSAISPAYAVSGGAITAPAAPTRSGYTFEGWNSAETGTGNAITFPYTMTGNITVYAKWKVYTAPPTGTPTPSNPASPAPTGVEILVNGKAETAATATTAKVEDKTVTTVTLDDKKIEEKLKNEGSNAVITIPVKNTADVVIGQLNGQTVKNLEASDAVLEIKTGNVTYTLPASQINIDSISNQIGQQVDLKDIKVRVIIAEPSKDMAKIVENTANKNSYQVIVKPVEFEITCSSGNKTVDVSKFNGYVERTVAIPDGIDPSKITTGIVLNKDGTFSHVPTTVIKISDKYYARISSLTNSTYSVIWSPKTFRDVQNHWAREAVNDMGSRLVIDGDGKGNFAPDRDITRAEFATIIVKALGLMKPGTGKTSFDDVSKGAWYYDAVSIAYEYGIISGYGNGKFRPMDKITREQAMSMIAKAMKITGLKAELKADEIESLLAPFGDLVQLSAGAKENIAACLKTGIITGRSGRIAPKAFITRAETAVIVRNLLKKSDLI